MRAEPGHRLLDRTFAIGLILKLLNGLLELVGGVLAFIVTPAEINSIVRWLTRGVLAENPHDPIANWLVHFASTIGYGATVFVAIYLLIHGAVKVVLVVAVLRDKLWAYPWLVAVLLIFIGYQAYELLVHFTWPLLLLTLFDVFIVVLTVREYQLRRTHRNAPTS